MLEIDELSHVYPGGVQALDRVSLSIKRGMFGLLGPNGAGKSTLMRCIATLQTPTSGAIRFDDIDVLKEPQRLRRVLGYLPQDFGVYPRVSAEAMLDHLAVLKGLSEAKARKAEVERLLDQVNLWPVRKKAVSGFSGGMRQRFGIAQALLGSPSLIVVDEPTAGLDPGERRRFLNLLAEIGDLCPAMAIIAGGRIVRQGAPSDLIHELEGRLWKKTIARDELETLKAHAQVISTRLAAGKTVAHVLGDHAPTADFSPHPPGLEDVYFSALIASRRAA